MPCMNHTNGNNNNSQCYSHILLWRLVTESFLRSFSPYHWFKQGSCKLLVNRGKGIIEPRHDKTNKMCVHPVKTQISLGIHPIWSMSSLSAWRKLGSLATHWVHSEDSGQTGRMPRLICVFAGHTATLLVLLCRSSIIMYLNKSLQMVMYVQQNKNIMF